MRRAPDWPPLFEALAPSPRGLVGLLELRAAATSADARSLYDRFESELCTALARPRVDWPPAFGTFSSRSLRPHSTVQTLPRLAPEQALVLLGPLRHLPPASANLYVAALEAAFGEDSTWPVPDETMLRVLAPYVPQRWRDHWTRGFGLEPPRVWDTPIQAAVEHALGRLAAGTPIEPEVLGPRGAVEVAMTFTTLRVGASLDGALPEAA